MKKYLLIFAAALVIAGCTKKPAEQKPEEQMPPQEQVTDGNAYQDITALTPEGTELSLSSVVGKSDYVLLDFWAAWCGPCQALGPIVEEVAAAHPEVKVGKVNVDEEQSLAQQFGIMSIPTLMVFKDGKKVNEALGLMPREQVESLLV
jgi:thioredoxin 1